MERGLCRETVSCRTGFVSAVLFRRSELAARVSANCLHNCAHEVGSGKPNGTCPVLGSIHTHTQEWTTQTTFHFTIFTSTNKHHEKRNQLRKMFENFWKNWKSGIAGAICIRNRYVLECIYIYIFNKCVCVYMY